MLYHPLTRTDSGSENESGDTIDVYSQKDSDHDAPLARLVDRYKHALAYSSSDEEGILLYELAQRLRHRGDQTNDEIMDDAENVGSTSEESVISVMLIAAIFVCLLTIDVTDSNVVNKNVLFRPVKKISPSNSRWRLTIVHDVKPHVNFVDTLSIDIARTLLTVDEIIQNYMAHEYVLTLDKMKIEIVTLRDEIEGLLDDIGDYRSLSKNSNWKKRALIPFVGKALTWLFGTVSNSDLELIRGNINILATNQQAIKHVVSESLSVINISRLHVAANRQQINTLSSILRKLDLKLQGVVRQFRNIRG
ncbi:hypothetical protein LOTGIDRAFT_161992 [Lottia gigantea]|uniref:Uncharacterized protein n=1 Tax=Lottia gigantea TaxID=225164 RepID=V4BVC3_LOTGI|nr:hypothetical protein LOTGIDRAFT_161992 [Lottia gigantea]ESO92964.1 hypothetical protein LOTGIDRAFT_161992 [Lottia gigantea]